jgi:hypothetical protein
MFSKFYLNLSYVESSSNSVWKYLNPLIFWTQNPWINSKLISAASPKLLFGPHDLRPLLQPPADFVWAAKAPPPAGHGPCPAASPISLSRQIIAWTASPPLPCLQSSRRVESSPPRSSLKRKLETPPSFWLMAAQPPSDVRAPIKWHRASPQTPSPNSISAFLAPSHLLDELWPSSLYFCCCSAFPTAASVSFSSGEHLDASLPISPNSQQQFPHRNRPPGKAPARTVPAPPF